MNVVIVYAHPSADSFAKHVKDSSVSGLQKAGYTYVVSDPYEMNFTTHISEINAEKGQ